MKLPDELLVRLEKAMSEIQYGEAKLSWAERGTFLELQILEKIRVEKPEDSSRG